MTDEAKGTLEKRFINRRNTKAVTKKREKEYLEKGNEPKDFWNRLVRTVRRVGISQKEVKHRDTRIRTNRANRININMLDLKL